MKRIDSFTLFGAIAAMASDSYKGYYTESAETKEQRETRLAIAQEAINKKRGLTKFYYGENYVWALNQATADRKAYARGYVTN